MRCTTSATLPSLLALSLLAALAGACSEDRTPTGPGGSTPKPKDAGTASEDAGNNNNGNPDATTNPNDDASTANADATMGNADAMACACDQNPNACDQGCACDPRCGNPDAGPMGNPDALPMMMFDGGVLTGDTFNAQQRAAEFAAAICAHRETCEPVYITYLPQNRAQCESETTAAILSTWAAYQPLINAGRMAFSQSGFTACINSYNAGRMNCAVGPDPLGCEGLFIGNRPEGAPCSASPECGAGTWCALTALGGCGTCTAYAQPGDDCSANLCAPGSECFPLQDGSELCIGVLTSVGQPCGTDANNAVCRGHLQCVGATQMAAGTCTAPAALNAACDPNRATGPSCNIFANTACGPNNTCVTLNVAGAGTACGMNTPTTLCNAANRCDTATSQCVALPGAGGMCNDSVSCVRGFFCQPNGPGAMQGTCNAELGPGSMCQASAQCAGNDYCIGGSCGPLAFNPVCN